MSSTRCIGAVVASAAFVAACTSPPPAGNAAGLDGQRKVGAVRNADYIGVVLRAGVSRDELAAHLPPEMRLVEDRWRGFEVIEPVSPLDRDGLTRQARELGRAAAEWIRYAGLLDTHDGARAPRLVTNEVVVEFEADLDSAARAALCDALGVSIVRQSANDPDLAVVSARDRDDVDAIELADRLQGTKGLVYAEPNVVRSKRATAPTWTCATDDTFFAEQWHLNNTGQERGTPDADIDAPEAWGFTRGSHDVVIAVLDFGFDAGHPDLVPNLWNGPSACGWDFEDNDATLEGPSDVPHDTAHGTCVAGCAAARGGNGLGVSGSGPECALMLLRVPVTSDVYTDAEVINWAHARGASIISISWVYDDRDPLANSMNVAISKAATSGRHGKGCVILCAADDCDDWELEEGVDLAAQPEVIAVGAATNTDERASETQLGRSLSVLGPTRYSGNPNFTEGTLDVATTDWRGRPGFNADVSLLVTPNPGFAHPSELSDLDYTARFGGTSAATPIVAGVAGLLLDADPDLTAVQVRRLLQDTADRIQDSKARYLIVNGRSEAKTHGFGRVNAFEAVRIVAANGGNGVDLFVRDNRLDWGNTEQPSTTRFDGVRGVLGAWTSPDVKVDAPPYAVGPLPTTSDDFDALADELPAAGADNRVHVRVRNRGVLDARDVTVHAAWTVDSISLPPWRGPGDNHDEWRDLQSIRLERVPPSGASLAGTPADRAGVVTFVFRADEVTGANLPPGTAIALLVAVDSNADRLDPAGVIQSDMPGLRVPRDNDVALRAMRLAGGQVVNQASFLLRNPTHAVLSGFLEILGPHDHVALLGGSSALAISPPTILSSDSAGRNVSAEFTMPPSFSGTLLVKFAGQPGLPPPPSGPAAGSYAGAANYTPPDAAPDGFVEIRLWTKTASGALLLGGIDVPLPTG